MKRPKLAHPQTEPAPVEASRKNTGKPELAYLFSFAGAVFPVFKHTDLCDGLETLAKWYQGRDETGYESACDSILDALPQDWPEQLARVSEFGAHKYARGNYLLGRGWSDTCCSLLRHAMAMSRGEECDPESGLPHYGHLAWNVCFLRHTVLTMPDRDDRIRAPKT